MKLAGILTDHDVDLIDVSTSGNHPKHRVIATHNVLQYQVLCAEAAKKALDDRILVAAVGNIHDGESAQGILNKVRPDVKLSVELAIFWSERCVALAGTDVHVFLGRAGQGRRGVRRTYL